MTSITLSPKFNPAITRVAVTKLTGAESGPESFVTQGVEDVQNPEVKRIAEDVLGQLKYSIAAVTAEPDAEVAYGSVEHEFQSVLRSLPTEKVATMRSVAEPMVSASPLLRQQLFGRVGIEAPTQIRQAGSAAVAASLPPVPVDRTVLGLDLVEKVVPRAEGLRADRALKLDKAVSKRLADIWGIKWYPVEPFPLPQPTKFSIDVLSFFCEDETNPEWPGDDEYALGGSTVDEDGDVNKIAERYIGGDFDDNEGKTLNWSSWTWFSLQEQGNDPQAWPKTYRGIFVLAEKDNGGFAAFLNDLYGRVRDRVKTAIAAAVTGVATPWLGPVIAGAVGQAVAWIVDQLIGWLINLFNDDIFPAQVTTMTHVAPTGRFTINGVWGSKESPVYRAHFYGHGGHSFIDYRWRLHD